MPPDRPGDHRRATARFGGLHPGDGRHFDHQKLRRRPEEQAGPGAGGQGVLHPEDPGCVAAQRYQGDDPGAVEPGRGPEESWREGWAAPKFDKEIYKTRNTVERAINRLRGYRAVATRYDKREFVYKGTIDVASIGIWLR